MLLQQLLKQLQLVRTQSAWGRTSFSDFDPVVAMRIVVPAMTAMVLGLQVVFSSLFYSVLGLARR